MKNGTPHADARSVILSAVRNHLPQPVRPLPEVPRSSYASGVNGGVGYTGDVSNLEKVDESLHTREPYSIPFQHHLKAMGGCSFTFADAGAIQAKVSELFPDAAVVCSTVPEVRGNRPVSPTDFPRTFADVDVAVFRSHLGVAEAGAVWLTATNLVVPSLGILAQHLIVLLDPADIVPTLHEAYGSGPDLFAEPYGVFMAGPSATGDIEGVIIHGAQGARSLTVVLAARSELQQDSLNHESQPMPQERVNAF